MDSSDNALWFLGDLSDPWVVSIAGELAHHASIVQMHCPGDLPERPFERDRPPRLIVIHRHRFSAVDAQRLKSYREAPATGVSPVIILCISPFVRYEELERWSGLADVVISEATAAEVLPRHVTRLAAGRDGRPNVPDTPRCLVEVAGSNHDLNRALALACEAAGYRVRQVGGPEPAAAGVFPAAASRRAERLLTIVDVPVLEPDWPDRLQRVRAGTVRSSL